MIEIKVGNLPLQGTKLFVMIAIKRSLGESMMRQPMIPAALHPKPMHMVKRKLQFKIKKLTESPMCNYVFTINLNEVHK